MRLGELVGATARPGASETVDVLVGGSTLVSGVRAERLATTAPPDLGVVPVSAADGSRPPGMVVRWAKDGADGYPVPVGGGELGGLLAAVNTVLPDLRDRFDAVAVTLRDTVNAQHRLGRDRTGQPGGDVFAGGTARTLTVALPAGSAGADLIAAAAAPGPVRRLARRRQRRRDRRVGERPRDRRARRGLPDPGRRPGGTGARRLPPRRDAAHRHRTGRPRPDLGLGSVNVDEEMTDLVAFQRAYEGAARVLTTIDETLNTLINRTGLVGR